MLPSYSLFLIAFVSIERCASNNDPQVLKLIFRINCLLTCPERNVHMKLMPREITASWPSALLSLPVSPVARRLWNTCSMSQQSVLRIHSPKKRLWGSFQYWDGILFTFQSLYPNICYPRPALRVWILTYAEVTPFSLHFILFSLASINFCSLTLIWICHPKYLLLCPENSNVC